MAFVRNPNGFVTIYFRPAFTDVEEDKRNFSKLESYEYAREIDPHALSNPKTYKKIWKDFMAFSVCTHLDGQPSFMQKLRYLKIYYCLCKNAMTTLPAMLIR